MAPKWPNPICHFSTSPRCLKIPLHNLEVTYCQLTESDLILLFQCLNIRQLKCLNLSVNALTWDRPSSTEDSCSHSPETALRAVWGHGLPIGGHPACCEPLLRAQGLQPVWEPPLHGHPGEGAESHDWADLLKEEFYLAPWECSSSSGALHLGRFTQFRAELIDIMRGFGGPRAIWLSSSPYPCWGDKILYHEKPVLYHCYSPVYLGASMKNIFLSSWKVTSRT